MDRVQIVPVLRSHHQYLQDADDATTKLLRSYTGADMKWMTLQDFLRSRSITEFVKLLKAYKSISAVQHTVSKLNSFIMNAPSADVPLKIYRGTGGFKVGDVGDTVVDWSFSGYSFEPEVSAEFAGGPECCLYELRLPANSPFLFIGYISKEQHEYEVLMPAGIEFKIVGERWMQGQHVYECDFIGIREDAIFSEDPTKTLRYDSLSNSILASRVTMILNTYRGLVKYGKENAVSGAQKKLKEMGSEFLNMIPVEKILDIYFNHPRIVEGDKSLLREILAAPSAPSRAEGGGRGSRRKTRRHLAKRRSSPRDRSRTKKTRRCRKV